ncbi:MAG: hypothetical protein GEU98_12890 [Pseudonocardiaceae bacterium]|nr:hypothetical protein [Pseudonocardiaceae bacterium]
MREDLVTDARLLCVHAHPDDESLWTGGILARYAGEQVPIKVITCTDGVRADGSSVAAPGVRVAELRKAMAILGAGEPQVLDYRDSGGAGSGAAEPGSFCAAVFDEVVRTLVTEIRAFRPTTVVTYDAFGVYGHPDHLQAHRATVAAVEASAHPKLYPESGQPWQVAGLWLVTTPDLPFDAAVDVGPWLDTKWQALRAHESEFDRGAGVSVFTDPRVREQLLSTEYFSHRPAPRPRTGSPATDLLAG